jgi:hypothetical protein
MNRNAYIVSLVVLTLAGFTGCSSKPAGESKAPAIPVDKIQGKVQVNISETSAQDAAMNAGGPSVYLWQGMRRYRLFFNTPYTVNPGKEYEVEGVYAQKAIDEMGDPDQGKNGYPLQASCDRVVRSVWKGLPFDVTDAHVTVLQSRIKRYPARPVFLVMKIAPIEGEAKKEPEAKEAPEVSVPAEKQKALLVEGPTVQPAPLWDAAGGTANCKVIIGTDGKISELESGSQLCESVPWDKFRYQPPVQGKKPVKVSTEVEIRFEPHK